MSVEVYTDGCLPLVLWMVKEKEKLTGAVFKFSLFVVAWPKRNGRATFDVETGAAL